MLTQVILSTKVGSKLPQNIAALKVLDFLTIEFLDSYHIYGPMACAEE